MDNPANTQHNEHLIIYVKMMFCRNNYMIITLCVCWLAHSDLILPWASDKLLSGKLWYLQHNYVGDTIVYH